MKSTSAANAARTGWFDAAALPARPGVYERRGGARRYACWDGARWRRDAESAAAAARQASASTVQHAPWRGLVEASAQACSTCRGHTVVDRGVDAETGADLIDECPDC
jgi:hypothetical protein